MIRSYFEDVVIYINKYSQDILWIHMYILKRSNDFHVLSINTK